MLNNIAAYYSPVYLILVAIFSLRIVRKYKRLYSIRNYQYPSSGSRDFIIVTLLTLIIGTRPISGKYFVDMAGYADHYVRYLGEKFIFDWNAENLLFDNLFAYWYCYDLGITLFFILISGIYFGCSYIGIQRIIPNHTLPAYLVFLAAFSTFSYATNGIKAGAAAAIFIMAMGYLDKRTICFTLALISLGFHHSMQLPVAALVITSLVKNAKIYYVFWVFCLIISFAHITYFQNLFSGFTDERGAAYLLADEQTSTAHIGFRPDFIVYSAIPVLIGFYYEINRGFKSKIYSALIHLYTLTNAVWLLCMYAAFNNRIAYLSWLLYPIDLIYPYLNVENRSDKYLKFGKVMAYHLYFTLFMEFVYYGLFHFGN